MQTYTDSTNSDAADMKQLEQDIREAIAQGKDIKETVHKLTLKAMQANRLDLNSLGRIATAVMQGIHEGTHQKLEHASEQSHVAKDQISHAVAGLDTALAQFVGASRLALEEAAGKAKQFSHDELSKTRADLESLESLFLEILQRTASTAKGVIADTLNDLLTHAKRNGTTIGEHLKDTLAIFTHHLSSVSHTQFEAGLQLAQITADLLHKISSGVLSGVSEQAKRKD